MGAVALGPSCPHSTSMMYHIRSLWLSCQVSSWETSAMGDQADAEMNVNLKQTISNGEGWNILFWSKMSIQSIATFPNKNSSELFVLWKISIFWLLVPIQEENKCQNIRILHRIVFCLLISSRDYILDLSPQTWEYHPIGGAQSLRSIGNNCKCLYTTSGYLEN